MRVGNFYSCKYLLFVASVILFFAWDFFQPDKNSRVIFLLKYHVYIEKKYSTSNKISVNVRGIIVIFIQSAKTTVNFRYSNHFEEFLKKYK